MSIPKFNLSKLRESVFRQQKATRQDIRNLLLLDRLQSDTSKQNQNKKSRGKSGEVYKVTINNYSFDINENKIYCDVEFIKYIGKKDFESVTMKNYDIDDVQNALTEEGEFDPEALEGEDIEKLPDGSVRVSQKEAEHHVDSIQTEYMEHVLKQSSTLLDNLQYFEDNFLLKDKDRNSWEITYDNGSEMFGNYDPRHWSHIDYRGYESIQIERK